MSKEIIINHSHHETRVALMEDGMLTELQYEREREQRIVGNIYKGRVVKVLPGMESAFIDIGAERAAFLVWNLHRLVLRVAAVNDLTTAKSL